MSLRSAGVLAPAVAGKPAVASAATAQMVATLVDTRVGSLDPRPEGRGSSDPTRVSASVATICAVATLATAGLPETAGARTPAARSVISRYMHRTVEVRSGRRFQPIGARHTISDGRGRSITAQVAMPEPTADGHGNLVFFFHGNRFLGWDSDHEALSIERLSVSRGVFRVRYANYAAGDPLCCPSEEPVTVSYRWTGSRLRSSAAPPRPRGLRVVLRR